MKEYTQQRTTALKTPVLIHRTYIYDSLRASFLPCCASAESTLLEKEVK